MGRQSKLATFLAAASIIATLGTTGTAAIAQDKSQVILVPSYRVGPFAPSGIPIADGIIDYVTMLNERDGGINGVKLVIEECETQYQNDRGVECYERYKDVGEAGLSGILPLSAGIGYALYDRAHKDKIPIITPGYGRLQGSVGSLFPYEFPLIANDWEQTTAILRYIAEKEGGIDKLKGLKIALVYLDSAYGKEPFPVLDDQSERYGFEWKGFPISASAMVEQRSTWLQIRRFRPDYVLMWGWGVMTSTALKEAAATGYPLDQLIGNWWSAAEPDVIPAGEAANGYIGTTFRMPGTDFPVYQDLKTYVFDKGKGSRALEDTGEILYNQGLAFAMFLTEGMRIAMEEYGDGPVTGEQTRWGLERMNLDEERLAELGFTGIIAPMNVTCDDHAGGGKLKLIQWDGQHWTAVSDWISGENEYFDPLVQESADRLGAELGRTKRDCASGG